MLIIVGGLLTCPCDLMLTEMLKKCRRDDGLWSKWRRNSHLLCLSMVDSLLKSDAFTLNCSDLVCFVSIPTFCIILIVPTRISLRRERCLVKAGPRRKEKVSTAADCQWFFCGKNLPYCYKKKGPKQLVKWTFWKKSKFFCHISRKLEELGRFLVFFFWKWPHLANRFHWFSNMQYR